jgi:glycosyltransferase involved in cell wall biosynthesis
MNVANGYWLPILRLLRIPTVMNVDGIEWERAKWSKLAKSVFKGGAKLASWLADELIVDAKEIGRVWRDCYGREGRFIPYGADIPPTLPLEQGLTHRGYILFVARLVPENTLPSFLDAAIELSRKYEVVIVGSSGHGGDLERRVADLAASSEHVRWLGHISDEKRLLSLWQHCGVYFHGHSVGGTNPSLVQAMACGAPVVARNTAYNREVLGDTGTFCDPEPESIRALLEMVMEGVHIPYPWTERAAAEYSWEAVCAAYDRVLTEFAGSFSDNERRTSSRLPFRAFSKRQRGSASRITQSQAHS